MLTASCFLIIVFIGSGGVHARRSPLGCSVRGKQVAGNGEIYSGLDCEYVFPKSIYRDYCDGKRKMTCTCMAAQWADCEESNRQGDGIEIPTTSVPSSPSPPPASTPEATRPLVTANKCDFGGTAMKVGESYLSDTEECVCLSNGQMRCERLPGWCTFGGLPTPNGGKRIMRWEGWQEQCTCISGNWMCDTARYEY